MGDLSFSIPGDKYNMKDLHKVLFSHGRGTETPGFTVLRSIANRPGHRGRAWQAIGCLAWRPPEQNLLPIRPEQHC